MSKRTPWMLTLAAVFVIQIAVPAWTIVRHERALERGETFRFRCAPLDPADLFRGRYVALFFDDRKVAVLDETPPHRGEKVWVLVEEDEQGFARLAGATRDRPQGAPHFRARVHWVAGDEVRVRMPFDRLYLPEGVAPSVEEVYRRNTAAGADHRAWVQVRILDGTVALENLLIDGVPATTLVDGGSRRPPAQRP